ncbi:hypothetical protein Ae707Ps1_6279c [Pseudonocardia sp. Ae707_Ps1]|nr:hypothetical protein Ae707Ps1_6246c [Pseudonocardia sp. Ae707_Ps1]OLM08750.1 hypothetical protein Ae707Ps1_6263c [Pseudonocardia sp. Ae707_Ps1]OLM08766.1 hypothetical protein Ae707Ps1_6279c [Pseudonocardia sp. Ae707_Ps1]
MHPLIHFKSLIKLTPSGGASGGDLCDPQRE